MARVFLSYDRDDEPRARVVAAALERAGHSVWWDRQIKGGGEFSTEIENALNDADKVVVLWSRSAVKSAWVRDEAAVGRETGRLVPATLDRTQPPLGFRQFQTIDLSRVKRAAGSPQLRALIDAVDAASPAGERPRPSRPASIAGRPGRGLVFGAAAILSLAVAVALGFHFWPEIGSGNDATTIAVTPADGSALSRQAAQDLTLALTSAANQGALSYQIVDTSNRRAAAADLTLSESASSAAGQERRDLALRSRAGDILWSASVEQPSSAATALGKQVSVQAARALSCAAEALDFRRERIRGDTLKRYVSACTDYDTAYGTNSDEGRQISQLDQVIAKAPHFVPAWSKLFVTEVDDMESEADEGRAMQQVMARQIAQAQRLGLDFGEIYVAKAATFLPSDYVDIFRTYEDGLGRYPRNANLYSAAASKYLFVGRMNDAVDAAGRAAQLDPQSPGTLQGLVSTDAYAGQTDAAYAQLRKAEQLWPDAPALLDARYRLDLRYGDPKEAQSLIGAPYMQNALGPQQAAFLAARLDPSPANIDRSIAEERKIYGQYPTFVAQIVQALAQFGHKDEVIAILLNYSGDDYDKGLAAEVLFRPAMRDVWRDPRSMAVAAHFKLLHYWKASGNWPDFCVDPSLPYDCKKEAAKYPA